MREIRKSGSVGAPGSNPLGPPDSIGHGVLTRQTHPGAFERSRLGGFLSALIPAVRGRFYAT